MRNAILALVGLLLVAPAAPAAGADAGAVVPRKWLVLDAVDRGGRRPLRCDAVFARHLLDRAAPPPVAGEVAIGELGVPRQWTEAEAKEDGTLEREGMVWAYTRVESDADRVLLAQLSGAGALFVDGAAFPGDVYALGEGGFPVALHKGSNDVYVLGPRGDSFKLRFVPPPGPLVAGTWRTTVPDALPDQQDAGPASMLVLNATDAPVVWKDRKRASLVPLGVARVDFEAARQEAHGAGAYKVHVSLGADAGADVDVAERKPEEARRVTFHSDIDDSIQEYAVLPPVKVDKPTKEMALVLTLHGASVDELSQARAYSAKPDFWIVAPTNRGRFGFDWQDWGSEDVYEVLEDALKTTAVDPQRVFLTGHSMGGHGTWNVAANDPYRFLAIAPSAGWASFDTYGGGRPRTPFAWQWRAADGGSLTLDLVPNLAQVPTYVLHGTKDDNVPISEAERMIGALTLAGGKPEHHFQEGAGHWWDGDAAPGTDCVDWPGIFDFFRRNLHPAAPDAVDITWMEAPRRHATRWAVAQQPIEYGRPMRIAAKWDRAMRMAVTTENVRCAEISFPVTPAPEERGEVVIDGDAFAVPDSSPHTFVRTGTGWRESGTPETTEKRIERQGPFKRAFDNRFVLVYGTAGTPEENRELLELARYHAEVWAYRANGDAAVMSDAEFLAGDFRGRNVILYGNADTNRAWADVLGKDCPILARRGSIVVGDGRRESAALACAFVRPRRGEEVALAAAFADTGPKGTRLFYSLAVFASGIGIPDYLLFGPETLTSADAIRTAGWFDHAWKLR